MVKFYAVKVGKIPGIYGTWDEAKKNVIGYPGSIYKSFSTLEDAENFIHPKTINLTGKLKIVYTDGSYKDGKCGYGFVLVNPNGHTEYYGRILLNKCTNNVAELYAIKKCLETIEGDLEIRSDSEYSINVVTGNKKASKNLELIEEIRNLVGDRCIVFKHVAAHTGIKHNEIADQIANLGRMEETDKMVVNTVID